MGIMRKAIYLLGNRRSIQLSYGTERTGARSADGLRLLSRTGLRSPPPAAGLKCVSAIRKRSRLIPSGRALSLNGLTGGVAAPAARKK
jgi:hypothetical protein